MGEVLIPVDHVDGKLRKTTAEPSPSPVAWGALGRAHRACRRLRRSPCQSTARARSTSRRRGRVEEPRRPQAEVAAAVAAKTSPVAVLIRATLPAGDRGLTGGQDQSGFITDAVDAQAGGVARGRTSHLRRPTTEVAYQQCGDHRRQAEPTVIAPRRRGSREGRGHAFRPGDRGTDHRPSAQGRPAVPSHRVPRSSFRRARHGGDFSPVEASPTASWARPSAPAAPPSTPGYPHPTRSARPASRCPAALWWHLRAIQHRWHADPTRSSRSTRTRRRRSSVRRLRCRGDLFNVPPQATDESGSAG